MMNLNCSDASTLKKLLTQILKELERANSTSPPSSEDDDYDDAYLYILLIMIFYGCLAGGLILAYTRSTKRESKNDPYHLYIEREWGKHALAAPSADESHQRGSIESENLL
ncbi:PREDICTED: potassium voltage-gated channel subfamily E regulatory beta subunit 5 [Nanorana parkeri]|uniref:potassium voltage-gated channel subfamily E regulatory beta subunit 5 n=1 Tax=Nanorana parkeri TaxID=125878 RepID=UPI000854223D|nr:PREDICTED: potassium voltage-gated channel subfamily E regulatory beta subunit 5 [Nanorana parkeri]